jgi:hypothetical protein
LQFPLDRLIERRAIFLYDFYFIGHLPLKLLSPRVNLAVTFLFVEIADMLLPAYLTLLESSIGNVGSFLLLVHFKVVVYHLLLNREPVLQDHCILDRS